MAKNVLGNRIADLLEQKNISQRELAERVGVTEVSMSRYINGSRIPKGPILGNIANVLGVTTDFLLGIESQDNAHTPDTDYYAAQRAIARNAGKWNNQQKADLVNAIFGVN